MVETENHSSEYLLDLINPIRSVDVEKFHICINEIIESTKGRRGRHFVRFGRILKAFEGKENDFVSLTDIEQLFAGGSSDARTYASGSVHKLNRELIVRDSEFGIVSITITSGNLSETFYRLINVDDVK